jgi:hypothetical protein
VELMIASNTITVAHAEALLKATPPEQRTDVKPAEREKKTAPIEQIEKLEKEMSQVQEKYQEAESNYGSDLLNLVVAKDYLTKLLVNEAVKSYIGRHEPEILTHLELVVNTVSMEEAVQQQQEADTSTLLLLRNIFYDGVDRTAEHRVQCSSYYRTLLCYSLRPRLLNVIRHGGSLPKTHSNPHRKEKARQFYDKSPSQTTRRHLFQGDAHPARKPGPHPARTGRETGYQRRLAELLLESTYGKGFGEDEKLRQLKKQVWLCLRAYANWHG